MNWRRLKSKSFDLFPVSEIINLFGSSDWTFVKKPAHVIDLTFSVWLTADLFINQIPSWSNRNKVLSVFKRIIPCQMKSYDSFVWGIYSNLLHLPNLIWFCIYSDMACQNIQFSDWTVRSLSMREYEWDFRATNNCSDLLFKFGLYTRLFRLYSYELLL